MLRSSGVICLAGAVAAVAFLGSNKADASEEVVVIPSGQSEYTEGCGGCHGLLGVAADESIPRLRDKVGTFLCTQEGREYLIRLPNIAFAAMDDEALADLMNFVVFGLGGESLPRGEGVRPYNADEVGLLRKTPFKGEQLHAMRDAVWSRASAECEMRR
tara:strand:- start:66860 stop:67336 length:477 start_codon:yes stop_codon:yes gene_type:complete